jgi:hypothetical protein
MESNSGERMTAPDEIMLRIGEGIGLGTRGQPAAARSLFARLWIEIGEGTGDPLHRCALAHSMADVQEDVTEELRWDLLALAAAELITDERVADAGIDGDAAGFRPSLHLNVAECYRRLGRFDLAEDHLHRGLAALPALRDGGYAEMVRQGLDRLAASLVPAGPTDS